MTKIKLHPLTNRPIYVGPAKKLRDVDLTGADLTDAQLDSAKR